MKPLGSVAEMATRPNILWYCTDQQRFDTIAALGNEHVITPTVDSLVENGVAFTHAYCQSPICTPSRASFLTGMYPSKVHNTRNGNESFPSSPPVVSKLLADSGYRCGLVGKFHLQSAGKRTEPRIDDGYSFWRFSHAPRDDWSSGHDYADWVKSKGGNLNALRESEERVPAELHQTTWSSDMAIEFIKGNQDGPWMLSVNSYDPHPPFIPPKSYQDKFEPDSMPGPYFQSSDLEQQKRFQGIDFQGKAKTPEELNAKFEQAKYYAMIALIDDQLKRILDVLDETGQRDNTVILFMSDHGETLGDHGLIFKGCRFYEGLVRVPLIFSCPSRFAKAKRCSGLVELIDVTATIMDFATLPIPEHVQGQTLIPYLDAEGDLGSTIRPAVRSEYFDALDPTFTGGSGSFATMYRNERYKLSVYHGTGLGELYDLESDPWEFENLWDEPSASKIKASLIAQSFDNHVLLTTDVGSRRIAPM
ncbi:sulfatase-like hydrolase/transferase [bacterium]|nr:sulfatase-like hydrolase/transferase [bacterium]MDA7680413.1 sulfatase-like hydrolase/transferase [bacterium]MDB4796846.1 sulfatase-like hydrolase/transferase [bacterium]